MTVGAGSIKKVQLLLDAGGGGGSDDVVDFNGLYSTAGGGIGFDSDYLQPPSYVFSVNNGY